jgi:hypothetical protein
MRDNSGKAFKDGGTAAWQMAEIDYVQKQVRKEMPGKRVQQVQSALDQCKRYIHPSEGREKLMACVREKLQSG